MGSWKMTPMRLPRYLRISLMGSFRRSTPSKRIAPERILEGGEGRRRGMHMELTDLPQPDSPTMQRISPRRTSKETS